MASNPRPVFKHPIPGRTSSTTEAAEIQRITAEQLCAAVTPKKEAIQVKWEGNLPLTVRTMISIEEAAKFTDAVLQTCWIDEGYYYEVMDFAFRCAVITYYSNVQLPEGAEQKYEMVYGTDLYGTILKYINRDQVEALSEAIKMYLDR